jgi:tetratricopeptide (TPR) repeat protein
VERAEAAARAGDWPEALASWKAVNATERAGGRSLLAEARAALALERPSDAEAALQRSTEAGPANPEPWRVWLEVLRVEDRPTDALRVGLAGASAVAPEGRRGVLRELTLALLADLPDDLARETLARWSTDGEGPPDPAARAALLQRMNLMPRAGDPPRDARIAELTAILVREPGHLAVREALATALADAAAIEDCRSALESWPPEGRDARYWRLLGRWLLEFGREPGPAADAFAKALAELPHDWKTRARLARALRALGRDAEARREAEAVNRLRERLGPATLGPRLSTALAAEGPGALNDLADLCAGVGLTPLADAWRREAERINFNK